MLKKSLKIFLTISVLFIVLTGSFLFWVSDKYAVPIMMYHNVDSSDQPRMNSVTPSNFAKHMAYLHKHGYHVIAFSELVNSIIEKKPLPKKSVVITFDDGFEDNYINAFPVLKQYHFPAIIFVVTDIVGKSGFLTWEQIKEMEKSDISFGSHTRLHTYLPSLDKAEQRNQIRGSKEILEQQLGHPIEYFAYPSGGFNDSILSVLKETGYKAACTTNRGYPRLNDDPYMIKRIRFGNNDNSDIILWAKLSGYYQVFKKWKNPE